MTNRVEHPDYYQGENGIETIEIIRHYTCDIANALKYLMRAGKKQEMGMEDAEKEKEDLEKALWYIEDYRKQYIIDETSIMSHCITMTLQEWTDVDSYELPKSLTDHWIKEQTGHTVEEIVQPYEQHVGYAIGCLLHIGLIYDHHELTPDDYIKWLDEATNSIQQHIFYIEHQLLDKELKRTAKTMNAFMTGQPLEAVDGEDYVSKPGCVRETEPEKYDPLNMILIWGRAYCLTDEVHKKKNGALYSPCDNCDLRHECLSADGTEHTKNLCHLHQAEDNEYYCEVGKAKYFPKFGTIEVVDEMKEVQLDLKHMQEEIDNDNDDQ